MGLTPDRPDQPIPGVRIVKISKVRKGDVYAVLLPDLITSGFHASFHPNELHFKDPSRPGSEPAVFGPTNLMGLLDSVLEHVELWMRAPTPGYRIAGRVYPNPGFWRAGLSLGDATLDLETMARGVWSFEIEPPQTLTAAVGLMRAKGLLRAGDILVADVPERSELVILTVVDGQTLPPRPESEEIRSALQRFRERIARDGFLLLTLRRDDRVQLKRLLTSTDPVIGALQRAMTSAFSDEQTDRKGRTRENPLLRFRRLSHQTVKKSKPRRL
jgi:hypothetical protein